MAVTGHRETRNPTGDFDARSGRRYVRTFHVDVDDPLKDGPATVWRYFRELEDAEQQLYFGKPYRFGGADSDEFDVAFLESVAIDEVTDEDNYGYVLRASYGPPVGSDPLASGDGTPSGFDPIEVDIDYAQFEEVVEQDNEGRPILNSARDPYNPGVTRDDSRYIVTITRNEAAVDFDLLNQIKDSVNKEPFLGRRKRCVKAKPPKARRQWNPDTGYYWQMTYQFEIKDKEYRLPPSGAVSSGFWDPGTPLPPGLPQGSLIGQGWDKVILDAGFRYTTGSGSAITRKQILIDSIPAQDPVPLNGSGAVLAASAQPVYRVYRVYPEFDYNTLGFGL